MRNNKLLLSIISGILLILTSVLLGCSEKSYTQSSTESKDTTDIRLVPVEQLKGVELAIGQKLSIPDLDIEIIRVSEKEVLVKTPVRQEIRTETTFVATKEVDKSRTYNDSFNKATWKDKSKVKEVTKQIEKTKTVDKNINRFPWWILILILLIIVIGWIIRKYGKMILPWPW